MDVSLSKLRELVLGQGGLAGCSPWGRKESDTTERQNWTELSNIPILPVFQSPYMFRGDESEYIGRS